jgi:hypothetical protein
MSKLITNSLIGSIDWYRKCPQSWKKKAYQDLHNMLARKWSEPSPAIKRGIDFENYVYSILGNSTDPIDDLNCSDLFKHVLKACKGGVFQRKNKSFMAVDGVEYCLYGKEDVTFEDRIIDIKTTGKFNRDKYLNSFQHKIYLYNSKKLHFVYIVVVFDGDGSVIQSVEEIEIKIDQVELAMYGNEIADKIRDIDYFFKNMPELKKLYDTKYSRY